MLYTREALYNHTPQEGIIAIQRYFHKIYSKETDKLCPHECDYLAIRLRSIYKEKQGGGEERVLEPYDLPFLSEAILKYLFLLYFKNLDFLQPVFAGRIELSKEEIYSDKQKFDELLPQWREKLHAKKTDRLIHEVKLEYLRKLAILKKQYAIGAYGWFLFRRKCMEQELNAFYIYFTVKAFFKNIKREYIDFWIGDKRFVADYYTYVHIISRHYIALFNGIDTEKTFNDSLPFIDPFNLPSSLVKVISDYFEIAPVVYTFNPEYMIFSYKGEHYIIWWKEKCIENSSNAVGYEIRTLYTIQSFNDRQRINNESTANYSDDLIFFY